MFERNLEHVKEYLEKIGARYTVDNTWGFEKVYVFEKEAYDKRKSDPEKYKDLYVSYLRISDHGGDGLYTRRDGICGEMTDESIKMIIDDLTGIENPV